ncbi:MULTISPECIES: BldC family transcriptional regulator [Rhodococcus]|uniref:BldC family transcriptional regulator n=1 Tax=Rhodococcus TaxID=1827 RepID=UPI002948ED45|nr:BldC family transcriptional regulator [Rhodococcus erythropolis]MDV6271870.1 BldC family transcriptional regulator [Rhodococcus erythropolis]
MSREEEHTAPVDEWLTTKQVAALFHVDRTTVSRWAREGKVGTLRTLGGHRRYRRSEIEKLLRNRLTTLDPT